ncbi:hypothetical protein D3C81_1594270 [compost metagenome]
MGRRVDRYHLNSLDRVNSRCNRPANNIIHMPKLKQILRHHVIRYQNSSAGIDTFLGNGTYTFGHIALRRAFANKHANTVAKLLERLFLRCRLMA